MNKIYSRELQDVLSYMTDILVNEFPTDVFTLEYLVSAILDTKKCHANLILDNCLMSNNIEELKGIYISYLRDHASVVLLKDKGEKISFNETLNNIMESAITEQNKINSNLCGTEHILLAILNPQNDNTVQAVLKTVGLEYNFILNKCIEDNKKKVKSPINSNNNKVKPNISLPLKSEVNNKAVSNKSEFIDLYTINLNKLAKEGKIDELIGREKEVEQIVKVLARRNKNNVVLVGKGGCGKTAIVKGISNLIYNDKIPAVLKGKEIVMLNIMALISGTHFRGMFEERVKGLFDSLKESKKYILFIDDIHGVLKGGGKDKDTDISSMIGDVLTEGEVRVIGTTSFKDYRATIESNTSISRKLQKIIIEPSSVSETIDILNKNKTYYEKYHNVSYSQEVITKCVELSERYITDRSLPDSAFDVMDLSGAYTCLINREPEGITYSRHRLIELTNMKAEALNKGDFESIDSIEKEENDVRMVISDFNRSYNNNLDKYKIEITLDNIATSVSDITSIPVNKLNASEKEKVAHIDEVLKESIIGQDEAIQSVCRIIKRNKVGLGDKNRTLGNLLLMGPSGSGKSLLAKKLAEEIFGDANCLVRIDMSEYSEKSSVSKLIGSSPGYIGYENGGQLTEAIKNKQHCVLLLDEIEKADQEVYNIFLQLFDEGRLTDSSGQIVNFKNVVVLMTSNIGARQASENGKGVGFITDENANKKSIVEKELKKHFSPEFINRIDQIVHFNPLSNDNLKGIVTLELKKFQKRLNNIKYEIDWDENVINYIHGESIKQKEYGARPIIRLIQDNIEDKITDLMLQEEYENNYKFKISYENEYITIK